MTVNNPDDRETDLTQREQLLRQRELELRIRELENKLQGASGHNPAAVPAAGASNSQAPEPPVTPTKPYREKKTRWNRWQGKLWMGLQFILIVIAVIVAIRIANWLGMALIVGMIAWVAYKVFFEVDD
jgi:hypothetical protein